uniref:DM10 domain-containing protein n=1 Tax=Panagrolaimus davidi TaxID=227884 RepID=A0A914QDJ0_9BILA
MNRFKSEPHLSKNCDCFDDDLHFFSQSFVKPRGRQQIFDKKDNVIFMKDPLSRPKTKSWEPLRNIPFAEYFDPLHKAALTFTCYLNETDGEEGELLKIRPMKLIYHLDDETMSLTEPFSDNSGHLQGRMFHSQKVPRSNRQIGNDFLTWKDIKVGEDLILFGRAYRIVSCDGFTKSFLEDRGIKVLETETIPIDSWNLSRHFQTDKAREAEIKKYFREKEKVAEMISWENIPEFLTFYCAWLDTKSDFYGERIKRTFKFIMSSRDDSVTMIEMTPGFGNQLFLKADRLPYITSGKPFFMYKNTRYNNKK